MIHEDEFDFPMIQTSCKDCVFAIWKENVQVGCKLNKIDLLAKHGAKLTQEKDETSGRHYVVINDRICMACRNSEWAKNHKKHSLEIAVRVEMTVRCDVVIPIDESYTLEEIEHTINSIKNQELLPASILVCIYQEGIRPSQIIPLLKGNYFAWKTEYVIQRNRVKEDKFKRGTAVETVLRHGSAPFYCVVPPGEILERDFLANIDKEISDNGERFLLIMPEDGSLWNKIVVQRKMHDFTAEILIEDEEIYTPQHKILYFAEQEDQKHMVRYANYSNNS
jgi:hypothetical protein